MSFMERLKQDLLKDSLDTQQLVEFIKELDEKERVEIEKKQRRIRKEQEEREKKRKTKKKVKKAATKELDLQKYGPYFNYTPFEWAVIQTKGKAPYNNEHVDIIANIGLE